MLYTIKNNDLEVQISDHGAEIKSIKYHGLEYLHDSNPKYWSYSAPLLFPNIGKLKDDTTKFNGINYPMRKHGFARNFDFKFVSQSDDKITFLLKADKESLIIYPFDFELYVDYKLKNNQLLSEIRVINHSKSVMPFNLGLHPAFKVPLLANEKFEDYHIIFDKCGTYETPEVDLETGLIDFTKRSKEFINLKELNLNYADYERDAIVLENVISHNVLLENKDTHHGVRFIFDDFIHLGIWTPNGGKFAPFICIEPWIGCADRPQTDGEFSSKRDLIFLKENEEKLIKYHYEFQ